MKVSTVILGASCFSVGRLLGDRNGNLLIVDRSASVGGEFFNSYRYCRNWQVPCTEEITKKLQQEMEEKGAFDRPYADFFALAPMLYRELIDLSGHFMLTTEIAAITQADKEFILEVYNQSGRTEIHCDKIIDTTISGKLNRIAKKRLNGIIIQPIGTTSEFTGFKTWAGRTEQEMFLSLEIAPAMDWPSARHEFIARFESETQRGDARIASIAKEFDYELISDGDFINPLQYDNPLLAIDAGMNMAGRVK